MHIQQINPFSFFNFSQFKEKYNLILYIGLLVGLASAKL